MTRLRIRSIRRARRQARRPLAERHPVAIAVVGLLSMTLIGLLVYNVKALPFLGGGTRYTADFKESAGLHPGDEVRIAGVKVGEVNAVGLDGPKVKVAFTVKDAWVGDASTVGIAIRTLLGSKYLAVDPRGTAAQNPHRRIPITRTTSPYDVLDALNGLGETVGEVDTRTLAKSFETLSATFRNTPPGVHKAVTGLADLSLTIASRDEQITRLLKGTGQVTRTLDGKKDRVRGLLADGGQLLAEVGYRRDAIHGLLTGAQNLSTQLSGVVADNRARLGPALDSLDRVTAVLARNKAGLDRILAQAGPYYRLVGNTLGNGHWMDSYLCGLVPRTYLPPGSTPPDGCMPPKAGGPKPGKGSGS
ncbi:MCE family protein [Streptomyces melanogenes]|uniref:MCE family protein n=1 Tax=Streptomyces melanogenes TaxID=67326 RepID=A0ABZ1XUG4_9ACTN|nr:MCE family protein [Streptomyces melanogenes]